MVYSIVQPSWRGLSVSISRKKIYFSDGKGGVLKAGLLRYSASSETSILTNISSIFSLVSKFVPSKLNSYERSFQPPPSHFGSLTDLILHLTHFEMVNMLLANFLLKKYQKLHININ